MERKAQLLSIFVHCQKKNCDTVTVTDEDCLHLIPGLSKGFVYFFLISKLHTPPSETEQCLLFLNKALCGKNHFFIDLNFWGTINIKANGGDAQWINFIHLVMSFQAKEI